jgi:hypothetical protein
MNALCSSEICESTRNHDHPQAAPPILKSDGDDKSAPDRVLQDKRLPQGAKVLWMYLKMRSNAQSQCWPTQRQIFAAIGCDGHSLKDWNEQLHEAGYLTFKKEPGRRNYTYTLRVGDKRSYDFLPDWDRRKNPVTPVTPDGNIVVENRNDTVVENHNSTFSMQLSPHGKGKGTFRRSRKRLLSLKGEVINEISFEVPDRMQFSLAVPEFVAEDYYEFAEQFFFEKERNGWTANGKPICYWRQTLVGFIAKICNCEQSEIAVIE